VGLDCAAPTLLGRSERGLDRVARRAHPAIIGIDQDKTA
jgi:hypothetical protein